MRDEWQLLWWRHRGKIVGTLLGLFTGWFLVTYGLWKFLVVVAFAVAGMALGARADGDAVRLDWDGVRRWWRR